MSDSATQLEPLDRWRRRVLAAVPALEPIELSLLDARGGVAAGELTATRPVPAHAVATADGFAVRAGDAVEASTLGVVGQAQPGRPTRERVHTGQAVRLAAGAVLPEGADAVLALAQADDRGDYLVVSGGGAGLGDHVRPAGEEVAEGAQLVEAGVRLRPGHLGLLAAAGHTRVPVHPHPRVSVLAVGDELVDLEARVGPGDVADVNGVALNAMARAAGAHAVRHPPVRGDATSVGDAVEGTVGNGDLLVVAGADGAVLGGALAALGDLERVRVAMEPGAEQAFGLGEADSGRWVPVFGVPGHPVAAAVSFEVFVRPAIRRLQGRRDLNRPRVLARLATPLSGCCDRVAFAPVSLHRDGAGHVATPTETPHAHAVAPLAAADGLAEIPAGVARLEAGDRVLTHRLVAPD
ncbi:MAG: molybdopterin molybdenumtransferase [Actinobacteria bacterium QS_8_72_14]|nr:MAG: molybdopterin molybdenumtransferase [Actinobacteria bacterium QS_8_72_14]